LLLLLIPFGDGRGYPLLEGIKAPRSRLRTRYFA
jgi:hypothetical protein